MKDIYLLENSNVLKNLLGIVEEAELDLAEAELSRANRLLLWQPFKKHKQRKIRFRPLYPRKTRIYRLTFPL